MKVWDVERGSELGELHGSSGSTEGNIQEINALAINSAATRLGAAYVAGGVDVWNPTLGKHLKRVGFSDEDTVSRCALSPCARWGVSAFEKHFYFDTGMTDSIGVQDLELGEVVHELKDESGSVGHHRRWGDDRRHGSGRTPDLGPRAGNGTTCRRSWMGSCARGHP